MEIRRGAPVLGEHTVEVLDELGYSGSEVIQLVQAGVVSVRLRGAQCRGDPRGRPCWGRA